MVRVQADLRLPTPLQPWAKSRPVSVGGTGTVIEPGRILTNAHLVRFAELVRVQGQTGGPWFEARVEAVGDDVDLAVLTVAEPAFAEAHPPLLRAEGRPAASSTMVVVGYPVGGNGLAITRGVVSRVGLMAYTDAAIGLTIQVDAAVNPGNSGGPAMVDGKMADLAFSRLDKAGNVGYIIPNENGIPRRGSDALMAIWGAGPGADADSPRADPGF